MRKRHFSRRGWREERAAGAVAHFRGGASRAAAAVGEGIEPCDAWRMKGGTDWSRQECCSHGGSDGGDALQAVCGGSTDHDFAVGRVASRSASQKNKAKNHEPDRRLSLCPACCRRVSRNLRSLLRCKAGGSRFAALACSKLAGGGRRHCRARLRLLQFLANSVRSVDLVFTAVAALRTPPQPDSQTPVTGRYHAQTAGALVLIYRLAIYQRETGVDTSVSDVSSAGDKSGRGRVRRSGFGFAVLAFRIRADLRLPVADFFFVVFVCSAVKWRS
jgi:hypothetical protein